MLTKKVKLLFSLLIIAISLGAQTLENTGKINWGIEYDLMAPRIGQWYNFNINGWIRHGQRIKHSLVLANIDINEKHLTEESFQKDILTAFGYRGEIFSHRDMKRWSTGIIFLFSMHHVETSINQQSGRFNTFFTGVPIGYTWVLWKHLTINPNISVLVPLTNQKVQIGTDEVSQAPWGLEPGLRIGYRF
ncbi:MAG: hypothetical protein JXA77_06930 [Bacteroidales bacterium]|nr:hypothetical protein [Bacteroidales bacterium]MBN2819870.1 hypothetical protein [Bacteroidales bacterium]